MTKVLVATDKAFAPVAVKGIRQVVEQAGFELVLLENYTNPDDFKKAIADADAVVISSAIDSSNPELQAAHEARLPTHDRKS